MIISVGRKALGSAVTACAAVTDANASMSALANVRIEAGDRVVLTGSDQYTTVISSLIGCVEVAGSCMVEAKTLRDIVASLPNTHANVEIEYVGTELVFRCGKSERTIPCLDADSYPNLAKPIESFARVAGAALLRALTIVQHAVCTDESRPNYCGINVRCGDGSIVAQSTDGHRLAHTEIVCETGSFSALLPGRGVKAIRAALTEAGPIDVEIGSDGAHATLKCNDVTTTLRLAEATFPALEKAFALSAPNRANVSRELLFDAIKRARVTSKQDDKDRADCINMTLASGEIRLASRGVKGKSKEVIDVDYDGPETTFGIQPEYMMETLSAMVADDVAIQFDTAVSPIRITPALTSESKFIVLPQRAS